MKVPMFVLQAGSKVTQKAAPTIAKLSAKSPEILLGVGVVAIVGGAVWACKSTIDATKIIEAGLSETEQMKADEKPQLEIRKRHCTTGIQVAQSYLMPAVLIASGIACIVISHNIQSKRLVAAIATIDAVNLQFENYRRNVIADQGADADIRYLTGDRLENVTFFEETDGKVKKVKREVTVRDNCADMFTKLFDDCNSSEWNRERWRNIEFFENQRVFHKRKMVCEGRVLWWDVMKDLGYEFDPVYTQFNWVLTGDGSDDEPMYIIEERFNEDEIARAIEAKENPEPSFWIEFKNLVPIWDERSEN